jgi:hypothetical protein
MLRLSSNWEPMGRQLVRTGVIHPIPVSFMDQHELRKGR